MSEAVLEATGVGRRLGGRWALRDVTITVCRGECVMLHGPNGSGKTTLLRVFASALSPTTGSVRAFGGSPRDHLRQIGLLSHADGHYDDLSGRDNLALARSLGSLTGHVPDVLALVGLSGRADDPVRAYSAGMRKRLAFARLLLKSPALVLLDEPYAALDGEGHAFVDALLASLRAEGRTVVISTHQVSRVGPRCDRSVQLYAGRVANGDSPLVDTANPQDSGPPPAKPTGAHT